MVRRAFGTAADKVVFMDRFRNGSTVSPLRQIEAYWHALRRGGDVPARSDVDPRGLDNVLSNTFILERIAPGVARFRIAGNALSELAGHEVRGMPLTAFFAPTTRDLVSDTLEHVFDEPAVADLCLTTEPALGRATVEARMVLLPLRSDLGDVSRALGGLIVAEPERVNAPCRFNLSSCTARALNGSASAASVAVAPQEAFGFAEAQKPLQGARSHLRLVKTDDD